MYVRMNVRTYVCMYVHFIIILCIIIDMVPLTCYLKNSTEFEEYLSRNLSLSRPVVDGILGATLNLTNVISTPIA